MRFSREIIEYMRTKFVTRHGKSTIDDHLTPSVDDTVNLGAASYRWDTLYARNVVAENLTGAGGNADQVDGFHAYAAANPSALLALDGSSKFPVAVITQGHGSGLDADTLDTLQPSSNPGANANVLQTTAQGLLTLKQLAVTGSANEVQATIKSNVGQSAAVFELLDSSDNKLFQVKPSGNASIGGAASSTRRFQITDTKTSLPGEYDILSTEMYYNPSAAESDDLFGICNALYLGGASAYSIGDIYGLLNYIEPDTAHTISTILGTYIWFYAAASASISTLGGELCQLDVYNASVGTGYGLKVFPSINNGSFTTFYGLQIDTSITGSGSFGTIYGVKIENLTASTAAYALYTGAGDVSLGDNLEFRQAAEISTTTSTLKLAPTADLLTDPGSNYILPVTNFDINIGSISKKYLTLHAAELMVETLVAQDTIATIGGRILVTETTKLIANCGPSDTTIDVEHNFLLGGDRVFLQADGKFECMGITSSPTAISGGYRYDVSRNLDGTGANQWYAGDAVADTGATAGGSHLELYSFHSYTGGIFEYIYVDDGGVFGNNQYDSFNFKLFPDTAVANDAVYFGMENCTFDKIFFHVAAGTFDVTFAYEYWDGTGWASFAPILEPDFGSTGYTSLEMNIGMPMGLLLSLTYGASTSGSWAKTTVNSVNAYWMRIRIVSVTSWTSPPTQQEKRVYRDRQTYGPTIVGHYRKSSVWNDLEPCWAIGNLSGLYGQDPDTYGVGLGLESGVHAVFNTTEINFYNSFGKSVALYGASSIRVGEQSDMHINLDATNGIEFFYNVTKKISIQTDGDLFIGSDLSAAATTSLAIFSNDQTYNGELVYAGDLLLGDNSSNSANILWDKSAGELLFRAGTISYVKINSEGRLVAGQGYCVIDDWGFKVTSPGTGLDTRYWIGHIDQGDQGYFHKTAYWATSYNPPSQTANVTWFAATRETDDDWTDVRLIIQVADNVTPSDVRITLKGADNQIDFNSGKVTIDSYLWLQEQASHPSTPDSGWGVFYVNSTTHAPWFADDVGNLVPIACGYVKDLHVESAYLIGATFVVVSGFNNTICFRDGYSDSAAWTVRAANIWCGKTIVMQFHWLTQTASPTGNVRWHWDYTINRQDTTRATTPTADAYKVDAVNSQYVWKRTYKELSGSSIQGGDGLTIRLYREGAHGDDTHSGDVYVGNVIMAVYWA